MKKYHSEYYTEGNWNANPFVNTHMNYKVFTENLTGKDKNRFLIWYYKTAKKMMTKEVIQNIKEEIRNKWEEGDYTNDEILLHDYEVVNWWFYKEKDYERFGIDKMTKEDTLNYMDSDIESRKLFIDKHLFDRFIKWKGEIRKKYPGLCSNYVTKDDIIKINVKEKKYPKCSN
jgi:hypothetical protein